MKHFLRTVLLFATTVGITFPAGAAFVVNDTWLDGTRTDPTSPTYSENGVDSDSDGSIESAWFYGNSGTMTTSVGHLITSNSSSSSSSWTTYFTPDGSEVNLVNSGDQLKVTWVFTPTGVNVGNTSQNFRFALVNTPSGSRLTSDGSPSSAAYVGYAVFMNFGQTLSNATPFQLKERFAASGDLLASSGNWTNLASGGTSGNHGYDNSTQYTFVMTCTRDPSNGLTVAATMTGGTLDNVGSVTVSFNDPTPNSFAYDTVGMRPSGGTTTANQFDTALFRVEYIQGSTPPLILTHPQPQNVFVGDTATFSVSASGTPPLFYRWYFNTNTALSATNSTLTITNAQASDAGLYAAVVSNAYGSVLSSNALLSVNTNSLPPTFTLHPVSTTAIIGDTVTFTSSASGTQPITYQWTKNTIAIWGATATSLVLTNVQNSDAATYAVIASNVVGTATSSNATLTVTNALPGDVYVATDGTVANPGTFALPTTLSNAIAKVSAGNTIWMRGGTYTFSEQITIVSTNTGIFPTTRKRIFAYAGEHPVLDFSSETYTGSSDDRGIKINGHLWYLKGLEVYRSSDSGIYISGKSNIVELCVTHHNRDTGIQLGRQGSSTPTNDWPAYNLILNCDSYDNYDEPPGPGENADGIDCKLTTGPGNVIRGCIAHNNIDDGFDLFTDTSTGPIWPVVIDQCIAYNNGTLESGTFSTAGDRNGFKLGGSNISVNHIITRSIAFGNGKNGFAFNSNPGTITVVNNLGWNNLQGNFKFDVAGPIFYNNASFFIGNSGTNDRYGGSSGIATGPSNIFWFNGATKNDNGLTVSSNSFVTVTPPPGGFTRNADGSINFGNFARLVNGSPLINAGTLPPTNTVTLPYDPATAYEGAPDIGAIEIHTSTVPSITLDPVSQTVLVDSNVTFTVAASGTAPLTYQWRKNLVNIPNATNTTLLLPNAQPSDAGQYSAIASNLAGTATSASATLSVLTAFQFWQFQYFGCTNCAQANASADPDGDEMSNQAEFQSGSNPTNSASALRIISLVPQGNDLAITWKTFSGHTNVVQSTPGSSGNYNTNFTDISGFIVITGSGEVTTNFVHGGGATNIPSQYYRIRVP